MPGGEQLGQERKEARSEETRCKLTNKATNHGVGIPLRPQDIQGVWM